MKKIFPILNLLLIFIAVFFGIKGFYRYVEEKLYFDDVPEKVVVKKIVSKAKKRVVPRSYYNLITDRNLFGLIKPEPVKQVEEKPVEELKQTSLSLKLWGTITGDDVTARAIIEETKARKQSAYKIGDTIQNATLKQILWEKVVLNVNGKDEILEMQSVKSSSRVATAYNTKSTPRPEPVSTTASAQNITLKRSMIDDAVKDLNKIMKDVTIRPYFENGKAAGLRLSGVRPNSIFRQMGLRNGDVIKGVDGREIRSADDAFSLYENLRSADSVSVEISRGGRTRNIHYEIQ